MPIIIFAFFLGCSSLLWWSKLPSQTLYLVLILCMALVGLLGHFYRCKKYPAIFALLIGIVWANGHAQWQLHQRLPSQLEDKKVLIRGQISSLPDPKQDMVHFEFLVKQLSYNQHTYYQPKKVRLSWYHPPIALQVGDTWQLWVKLKSPRSTLNPGEFDFARWLFEQGIGALGYVINSPLNQHLANAAYSSFIQQIRQHLTQLIQQHLPQHPMAGFITALVTGSRNAVTTQQWQILQATGTNHLIAIAGLHIGLVASFAYFLINFLWRRLGTAPLYLPTPHVAALAALIAAVGYSALAGFALPTQRAVLMLSVFLISTLLSKHLPSWQAWLLALGVCLAWDPLAILGDSFWLSFGTVALILYSLKGRHERQPHWQRWLRLQCIISIGLIPLSLLFFHQLALSSIVANTLAIPWVGFVVLPLSLLGSLLLALKLTWGHYFLVLADQAMTCLWPVLQYLAELKNFIWQMYIPGPWVLLSLLLAIVLLLSPPGIPGRWLSPLLTLPLLLYQAVTPAAGSVWFTLLDVGQGLSAVVRTQHHTLVYDAGMRYTADFDMGSAVVIPFLLQAGVRHLDMLIISHADLDHRGGAAAILHTLPPATLLTSVPNRFPSGLAKLCQRGQKWVWDKVEFEMLYPPLQTQNLDNDSSCVLRISTAKQHILLTGDIEAYSEHYLVEHQVGQELASTILVAAHHGSKTSSTPDFIKATHPNIVLFPVGYHNRFHFPHKRVIERYQANQSMMFDTANHGAITFGITSDGTLQGPELFRKQEGKYWD